MLKVLTDDATVEELSLDIDAICRDGAQRMLAMALEVEVALYIAQHSEEIDEQADVSSCAMAAPRFAPSRRLPEL